MVSIAPPRRGATVVFAGPKSVGKTGLIRRLAGKEYNNAASIIGKKSEVPSGQTTAEIHEATDLSRPQEITVIVFTAAELVSTSPFWDSVSGALSGQREQNIPLYFVLSKIDEAQNRSDATVSAAKQKAEHFGAKLFQISAKTGEGVESFQTALNADVQQVEARRTEEYQNAASQLQDQIAAHLQ